MYPLIGTTQAPVSYTHLLMLYMLRPVGRTFGFSTGSPPGAGNTAVSYTHLDVYKRQAYISAFGIFEEKGVYAIVQREMSGVSGGFGQVDYADQRVQGFETEHLVVLVYCIELDYFFHKRSC